MPRDFIDLISPKKSKSPIKQRTVRPNLIYLLNGTFPCHMIIITSCSGFPHACGCQAYMPCQCHFFHATINVMFNIPLKWRMILKDPPATSEFPNTRLLLLKVRVRFMCSSFSQECQKTTSPMLTQH